MTIFVILVLPAGNEADCVDRDGDLFCPDPDGNVSIHPGAVEVIDSVDNDRAGTSTCQPPTFGACQWPRSPLRITPAARTGTGAPRGCIRAGP